MFEKNSNLTYTEKAPRRIAASRFAKKPNALLSGASATLVCTLGEASVLVDFDEEIVGGLILTVTCTAKTKIRIDYEEEAELALRREPLVCSWYTLVFDEYELEAGTHTLKSKGRRGFRFANISAESEENVIISAVTAISGAWDVCERGFFRCSDEKLNRIWDISAATAKACMQDFYEDGVKRDGLLWLGDYRWTFPSSYYISGDASLARKSILMMRDSQYECGGIPACAARGGGEQHHSESGISYMPRIPGDGQNRWIIPNYMCDYIRSIEEYILFTGDESILSETLESAEKALRFLLTIIDLETPGVWYMDTYLQKRDEYGFNYTIHLDGTINPKTNISSKGALLMEMLAASDALCRLAKKADQRALAEFADETAKRLDAHIETHYFDEKRGQYLDYKKQKFFDISQYTAPRAVLAGKSDPLGMERMMRSILPNVGFSLANRIEATFRAGFVHKALQDISAAWGKMLNADSRTCWERLDLPEMNATHYYDAIGSLCHGWTSSPAYQLPAWIVGVKPTADGFRHIEIAPKLDTLDFAEATVPTPHGDILARVQQQDGAVKLWLEIPEGIERCTVKWTSKSTQTIEGAGAFVLCYEK